MFGRSADGGCIARRCRTEVIGVSSDQHVDENKGFEIQWHRAEVIFFDNGANSSFVGWMRPDNAPREDMRKTEARNECYKCVQFVRRVSPF